MTCLYFHRFIHNFIEERKEFKQNGNIRKCQLIHVNSLQTLTYEYMEHESNMIYSEKKKHLLGYEFQLAVRMNHNEMSSSFFPSDFIMIIFLEHK